MPTTELQYYFSSETAALAAARAVSVELTNTFEKHSEAFIHTNKNVVLLKIVAQTDQSLKASSGFYSRLLGLCGNLVRR